MSISRRHFCRIALMGGLTAPFIKAHSLFADTNAGSVKQSTILTLLHTNDPHGRVYLPEEAYGLTRVATLVRQIRQEMPHVLLLDAGDLIHGTPEERAFAGRPMIEAMNALQYDVATAGNHEFDFGQRITRHAFGQANFPILSANILDEQTNKPWHSLKPYVMREVDGMRIAIFGLTTVDTVKIQFPRTLEGIRFADPIATGHELVPHLRTQERADLIVFLSHLGYLSDRALAQSVPGIDIILGGHSHTRIPDQRWVNGTLIMQTGFFCRSLGRTDVLLERLDNGKVQVKINGQDNAWWGRNGVKAPLEKTYPDGPLLDVSKETPHDPAVMEAYLPYATTMQKRRDEVLTTRTTALPHGKPKEEQSPIGQLLADAVRAKFSVDVALVPSGAVAKGLPAGDVRISDALSTISGYTRQHIVTARVTGRVLRNFFETAFTPNAHKAQVAGIDITRKPLSLNGQALNDNAIYTIASAAYLIQDDFLGQDGTVILTDDPEAPTTRDALIEYLRNDNSKTGVIGNQYF